MLTEKQFLYAYNICSDNLYNVSEMPKEHRFFLTNRLIDPIQITKDNATYIGYQLNARGQQLYEEYKRMCKDETRKDKTLKIAEDANRISKKANRLSVFAIVFSAIAAIGAIVSACVSVKSCTNKKTTEHFVNIDNHHLFIIAEII